MGIDPKEFWLLLGHNGAGKSVYGPRFITEFRESTDCDIFHLDYDAAAKLRSVSLEDVVGEFYNVTLPRLRRTGKSILMESVQLEPQLATFLAQFHEAGYKTGLIALATPTLEMAYANIAARVAAGGHNQEPILTQRYYDEQRISLAYFLPFFDEAQVYSSEAGAFTKILSRDRGEEIYTLHVHLNDIGETKNPFMNAVVKELQDKALLKCMPTQMRHPLIETTCDHK